MPSKFYCRTYLFIFLLLAMAANAQTPPTKVGEPSAHGTQTSHNEVSLDSEEVPDVPGLSAPSHGWNVGITISGVHESVTGWATLAIPSAGYSLTTSSP